MNKLDATKLVARLVVGIGTTTISNAIIKNNVVPANIFQRVSVPVASFIIGSMASEATRSHTDAQIDAFAKLLADARNTDDPITLISV